MKLHLLLCLCLALKLEVRRDGITRRVAAGDHRCCEGTLQCPLPNLRKPWIVQNHLRLAATVLSAPVERQARFIEVNDVCQLLLWDADLVCDQVKIRKPELDQVALPIVKPQQQVLVCCPPDSTLLFVLPLVDSEVYRGITKHALEEIACFASFWQRGMKDLMHTECKLLVSTLP